MHLLDIIGGKLDDEEEYSAAVENLTDAVSCIEFQSKKDDNKDVFASQWTKTIWTTYFTDTDQSINQ